MQYCIRLLATGNCVARVLSFQALLLVSLIETFFSSRKQVIPTTSGMIKFGNLPHRLYRKQAWRPPIFLAFLVQGSHNHTIAEVLPKSER